MRRWLLVLVLALAVGANAQELTLDRLYSLPSLIGTRPEQPVWSPDSRSVAFLWNSEGNPFLDVWVVDAVGSGKPKRLTSMTELPYPAAEVNDVTTLQQRARFESDHGISSISWESQGKSLLFVLRGELFRVTPGERPRKVAGLSGVTSATVSSEGAAILAKGQLWTLHGDHLDMIYASKRKEVEVGRVWWSPDGSRLAFEEIDSSAIPVRGIPDYLTDEAMLRPVKRAFPGEPSEKTRVGIVSAAGGTPHWFTLSDQLQDLIWEVSWSPDSRALLVDKSDLYIKDRRILTIDASSGATKTLVREQNPRNVTAEWWSGWNPQGTGIYFVSDFQAGATDYQIYAKPLNGGPVQPVTAGDWAVTAVQQTAGGLFAVGNKGRREERQLFQVTSFGVQPVTTLPGTHTPSISPDGRFVADVFSSDAVPPDLYLARVGEPELQVTHSASPDFAKNHWITPQYIAFPNVHDGTMLHGRLTLPSSYQPGRTYPLIVGSVYSNTVRNQWGGRIFHPTWGLDQYLAHEGYVLLNVDISGSDGYGRKFRERLAEDYGGVDVEDLYSGVQWLEKQGYVDPASVGMWGSSYGGLLTTTSLFVHPGIYKAGVAGAPATSLFHAMTGEMRTMMAPADHQAQYAKSSAYLKSGGLDGHLMIIQGMRDEIVLFQDSVKLEERLILQGKDITLISLPDAPHGWDTEGLAQTRYAYRKLVAYFDEHLRAPATSPVSTPADRSNR